MIKINSLDGDTQGAQEVCLKECYNRKDATACQVIWGQHNRGCYIHTDTIAKGSNDPKHLCWVFSKCNKSKEGKALVIVCLALM